MKRLRTLFALLPLALPLALAPTVAHAQGADAPGPVGGAPAALPAVKLPELSEIRLPVPRTLQAVSNALGQGRKRLALVVGIGTLGARLAVDSAPRDVQAVAVALKAGGFVVMMREDIGAQDLRATFKEFQTRLQPGDIGFAYFAGLGVQLEGQNLLLPRDAVLTGASTGLAAQLRTSGVPLQELVDALMGTPESPRMLVVDAAYRHPALSGLAKAGLAEQKLPQGMMALFGQALGEAQDVPAVAPLPEPPPTDPRELAGSRFTRVLVGTLTTPRLSGPEALRTTQRAIVDATLGQATPWIAGDTDAKEDFAEATLLDSVLPRTPEDFAREGGKQVLRNVGRPGGARVASRAGEQSVAEVLEQPAAGSATPPAEAARPAAPEVPAPSAGSLGSTLSAVGSAVGAAGTVANIAGTVAAVAVGAKLAEASAAVSAAGTVVGVASTAGSALGNVVSMATRASASSSSEQPARQAVQQLAAAKPTPLPPVPPAAPVAPVAPAVQAAQAAPAAPSAAATAAAEAAVEAVVANPAAPIHIAPGAGPAAPATALPRPALPAADGRTTRQADGGERPVYAPRTNNFGYAEGDTFTYQVLDTWKDEVLGSYTTAIEEVLGDGQLLANGHQVQMDPQGRLKSQRLPDGSVSQFEPAQELWWSNPKAGEGRRVNFTESFQRVGGGRGQTEFKGTSSVGKLQKIETPAGEFEALPIETSGWFHQTMANGTLSSGQFSRTVWYAPKLGHPVAIDIQDADRIGKLLKRERVELMHAQQARGAH